MDDSESTNKPPKKIFRHRQSIDFASKSEFDNASVDENEDQNPVPQTSKNLQLSAPMFLGNALSEDVFKPTDIINQRRGILKRPSFDLKEDCEMKMKKKIVHFPDDELETIIEIPNSRPNLEVKATNVEEYKRKCNAFRKQLKAQKEANKLKEDDKDTTTTPLEGPIELCEEKRTEINESPEENQ